MHKLLKQAFTLIELLVVIAIIGILSGLIIVGMSGMTDSANIAKAQVFANSLRNALMMNTVGEWKLDQVNSPNTDQTPDSWSGNTCTLKQTGYAGTCDSTHCPQLQTTGCVSGNCLKFDGVDDYVDCGNGAGLNISDAITVGVWAKINSYNWTNAQIQKPINSNVWPVSYAITGYSGWNGIYAWIWDGTDGTGVRTASFGKPSTGGWHYYVMTWVKGDKLKSYLDSTLIEQSSTVLSNSLQISAGNLGIGRDPLDFFNGSIDDVRIYNAAMPTSQIKEQYYAGLNSLLAKGEITKQNYQNMMGELAVGL